MKMWPKLMLGLALAALAAPTAAGESIFSEDFQDGEADGWGAGGDGDVGLTTYAGNVSMRMTKKATAFAAITTQGFSGVRVSASFAAGDLEGRDQCVFEVSPDDGQSWLQVLSVQNGQDDLVTLHRGSIAQSELDDLPRLILRARVAGNAANDTCWLDGIDVTGTWMADEVARVRAFDPDHFLSDVPMETPAATSAFAPSGTAEQASSPFQGQLSFAAGQASDGFAVLQDRFDFGVMPDTRLGELPAFAFDYKTKGEILIPDQTSFIAREHPFWEYVLTPGRIWSQPGDGEWTRAALPFALIEKNANCAHNGLLTFLFKADGSTSKAIWQIGSETCAYFQFNAWGRLDISYEPTAAELTSGLEAPDTAMAVSTEPLSALNDVYPDMSIEALAAPVGVTPENVTLSGLVLEGVHYVSDCPTRFGPYPYCDELVLPSYSFAKSMVGGLALMRLEQAYPGAKDAIIADYIPQCAAAGHWDDVTFEDALDMTTGRYRSTEPEADENEAVQADFFIVETHAEKIELACSKYPRKSEPGDVWVYHTTDTYILGTAMAEFLREKEGSSADIYRDLLVDPVWTPLGMSPTLSDTRRTYDERAQTFAGWGLVLERADLAKLLAFLQDGTGMIDGEQVLDRQLLQGALQRDPADPGLTATNADFRYNNGFWAWNYKDFGGCEADTWIPFMSGFGGLSAVLMPNGASYYYVSDGYEFTWGSAVKSTEAHAPVCGR